MRGDRHFGRGGHHARSGDSYGHFGAGNEHPFERGGDWGEGRGRFGRRGRGRRRMFDSGELRLVLLGLIADKPRHGYDLIRAIEERTGGAYAPSPGIVYPTLTLLAEMGLVEEQGAEGTRKLFAITSEGSAHLAERDADVKRLFARLDAIGELRGRTDAAPVRRALHNLRSVLDHRLGAGLEGERMYEAVALIDEAARKIERL